MNNTDADLQRKLAKQWLSAAEVVDDVREALGIVLDTWQRSPHYECVTGLREAVGDRPLVDQTRFA